jgi:UDP-GlcNAc:undecaprenyl-phosphate/decaprenyl-phosphate GlcNAc-1-phosphate transferase
MNTWYFIYLFCFVVALALSLIGVPIFRRVAMRTGFVSKPHLEKQGLTPIPLLGGAAIFVSFFLVVFGSYLIALIQNKTSFLSSILPQSVALYIPGVLKSASKLLPMLAGGILIFILGLIDDKRELAPVAKLGGQFIAAFVPVIFGTRLTLFIPNIAVTSAITVLWLVFIINAFNYLDNMDGLSAGVAFLASIFFLFAAVQIKMYFVSATLAALAGALLGFLYYNFNPARIYMGDAGSMFIGYLLAVMTVESTFYQWTSSKTYFPLLMPIIVLAIPIYEMATVIWVRLRKGISPFKPSKDHLSYRLASLGLSVRGTVVFIYFLTTCIGIAALLLPKADLLGSILILLQVVATLSIVAVLIHYGKKGGKS